MTQDNKANRSDDILSELGKSADDQEVLKRYLLALVKEYLNMSKEEQQVQREALKNSWVICKHPENYPPDQVIFSHGEYRIPMGLAYPELFSADPPTKLNNPTDEWNWEAERP